MGLNIANTMQLVIQNENIMKIKEIMRNLLLLGLIALPAYGQES
jgi:hypothetical protein